MADSSRGRFVWYDLMTPDPKGAEAFYAKVTGWGTQPLVEGYTMWTAAGTPIGGVMGMPEPTAPVGWLAYISVADIDAAASQLKSLGGTVIKPPATIPDGGRFAIVTDPQGAMFCLFSPGPGQPSGSTGSPKPGEFSWHELATTDWRAAWSFYQALFGWEKRSEFDMGPMGIYLLFDIGGVESGGLFNKPAEMAGPPAWLQYVLVDSADAAAQRVTANGGTVINGPMDVPGGDRIAQCLDPQGAMFAVHSKKA
jgi:predicted enzyme related to lactoylglutathione lyase